MTTTVVSPAGAGDLVAGVDLLRPAVAAYLARFKGVSRSHTESDLRCFLIWCVARELDPLAAKRTHIELYVQWMQEIRRFQPSTVSRRLSVVCGFYRTCVLDTVMRTRRPSTSGARPYPPTHRPWDWGICSSRPSCPPLVSHRTGTTSPSSRCLACWACGSSRPPQRTSPTWGRSTATACCACTARATRPCWSRCHRRSAGHWTIGSRTAGPILLNRRGLRMDRHAATRRLRHLATTAGGAASSDAPTHAAAHIRDHHASLRPCELWHSRMRFLLRNPDFVLPLPPSTSSCAPSRRCGPSRFAARAHTDEPRSPSKSSRARWHGGSPRALRRLIEVTPGAVVRRARGRGAAVGADGEGPGGAGSTRCGSGMLRLSDAL